MAILANNAKLIKVGIDYSAGENIGINDGVISSRNWTPDITYAAESAFQRANGYTDTQIGALSGEVSAEVSQLGSDVAYISSVALTSHQSLEGYLTKASGDEYYQPIGSYATVSQLETTSGEIVNLIPSIEGLATEEYVNEQTSGKADKSEIPDVSQFITNVSAEQTYQPIGNYLSSNALEGYATSAWVVEQGYITGVNIPESATWNEVSTTVQSNSAQWAEGGTGGDEEVNSFVYNNSADILDVDTTYQQNSASYLTAHQDVSNKLDTTAFSTVSGDFLTAAPADMATTGDVAELAQTISETYQVKGDYLTTADSANFYPNDNPSGFITGVDLSNYYTKDETSGKEELSNAFANIPTPDYEVESYIHNNSASIDESTSVVQSNSSTWSDVTAYQSNSSQYITAHQSLDGYATENWVTGQGYITEVNIPESANWEEATSTVQTNSSNWDNVTNKLDTTSFSTVSGDFLTAVDLTPYQTIEGMTAYQPAGDYYTTAEAETLSSMLSGAIDYVSANAGDEFPVSADEAIQYVQTNSAGIDDSVTSYQTNSGTFLTAHQAISAEEWNSNYETVNTNSASWGGDALPITGRDGIDLEIDNGTLYIGASAMTGSIDYIQTNSANIDEVVSNYQTASGTYLTAHQSLEGYVTESGFEYDGNDLITAYNGSAFAGQGGGGGGTGDMETVLWSGTPTTTVTSVNLSESWANFQTIKLYGNTEGGVAYTEFDTDDMINNPSNKEASLSNGGFYTWNSNSFYVNITIPCKFTNALTVRSTSARYVGRWGGSWQTKETNDSKNILTKIVGVNRKQ